MTGLSMLRKLPLPLEHFSNRIKLRGREFTNYFPWVLAVILFKLRLVVERVDV